VTLDWPTLQRAVAEWDAYAMGDPKDATRRVRQVAYHLHLDDKDGPRFLPLRLLIAWSDGVPFAQQGGRSIDMKAHYETLADVGLARIAETSPFFGEFWERYSQYCADLGNAPACYIGDDPRTGRIFWTLPV
jgi:sugar phosphate isomerase/epimerase